MFCQTQTARRSPKGPKMPFLSSVTLTFDTDLQTCYTSEGPNTINIFRVSLAKILFPRYFKPQRLTAPKTEPPQLTACDNYGQFCSNAFFVITKMALESPIVSLIRRRRDEPGSRDRMNIRVRTAQHASGRMIISGRCSLYAVLPCYTR